MKDLSFVGAGYVGLCNGVGFSSLDHKVFVVDIDEDKVRMINSGISPIYEMGLEERLKNVLINMNFIATTNLKYAIDNSDITFICVQTPSKSDGSIELKYIRDVAEDIGKCIKEKDWHLVVIKSTVIPSTTEDIIIPILERFSGKRVGEDFGVCMSPEFLSEGNALQNFFHPDRIVIGEYDEKSGDVLDEVYSIFDEKIPLLRVDLKTAEMIKYASNAFIGMKISYANEIGNICKQWGIDGRRVMEGVALDSRFSSCFMKPGMSFGGPCLRKDILALIAEAKDRGYDSRILRSIIEVNDRQDEIIVDFVKKRMRELNLKKVGILGLAFKANVSDVRDSQAIDVISALKEEGVDLLAYDPKAEENMRLLHPGIDYKFSGQEVIDATDIVLILTDWKEFSTFNYRGKIVIDGRGIVKKEICKEYEGICW